MDHFQFESVVLDVVQQLPDWVYDALDNIDLLVEDEAAPGVEVVGAPWTSKRPLTDLVAAALASPRARARRFRTDADVAGRASTSGDESPLAAAKSRGRASAESEALLTAASQCSEPCSET